MVVENHWTTRVVNIAVLLLLQYFLDRIAPTTYVDAVY